MRSFIDGPFAGTFLDLRRAPIFLRLVQDSKGNIDALDQLRDMPADGEHIFVYVLTEAPNRYHICIRGKRRGASGWRDDGRYKFVVPQPEGQLLLTPEQWKQWVMSHTDLAGELAMRGYEPEEAP